MPIPSSITDLSTNPASNSPLGSESPTAGDDYLRAMQAIMRKEHDAIAGITANAISATDPEFGVDPLQTAAFNTPRMQAALDACVQDKLTLVLPRGFVRVNATLAVDDAANISIMGPSPQGGLSNAGFIWDGANGGTVMLVNRTRDSEFGRFTILQGTGAIGIGIDIDNAAPLVSPNIATNQRWFDVFVDGADVGFWISRTSTANNDLHRFYRCRSRCLRSSAVIAGSSAWRISHSQAKFIHFETCTSDFSANGIDVQGGSVQAFNHNFSHNTVDLFLGSSVADSISLVAPQSESAGRFLDDAGATSGTVPVTVFGGRLSPDAVNADTFYIRQRRPGPTTFIGTQISQGVWNAGVKAQIGGAAGANVSFISCNLPNDSFIATTSTQYRANIDNCKYRDSGGTVRDYPQGVEVYNVKSYGAIGNNVADDTAAVLEAISECPEGGTVFFPALPAGGRYVVSSLGQISKSITLAGDGWWNKSNQEFGNAEYSTVTNAGGSVIRFTGTTGIGVNLVGTTTVNQYQMSDLLLIGPGSGTSVGVSLGSATVATVQNKFSRVGIMNFATGMDSRNTYESDLDIVTRGCSVGFDAPFVPAFGQTFNNNVFRLAKFENEGGIGCRLTGCAGVVFDACLFQNCASGLELKPGAAGALEAITIAPGTWFENVGGTDITIDTTLGAVKNILFKGVRSGGSGAIVWTSPNTSADVKFEGCAMPGKALTIPAFAERGGVDRECNFASIVNNSATFKVEAQEPRPVAFCEANGTAGTQTFAKGLTFSKLATGQYRFTFAVARTSTNYAITTTPLYTGTVMVANYLNKSAASFDVRTLVGAVLTDVSAIQVVVHE